VAAQVENNNRVIASIRFFISVGDRILGRIGGDRIAGAWPHFRRDQHAPQFRGERGAAIAR
jgi:hypothetical protein